MSRFHLARRTVLGFVVAAGLVVTATGCALSAPSARPSADGAKNFSELAEKHLAGLAGVEDVDAVQSPRDLTADPDGLDGLDASKWSVEIVVTMTETATPDASLSASMAEVALSEKWAVDGHWTARLDAGRETTRPEDDISSRRALSVEVFPSGDLPLKNVIEGAVRISGAPGVNAVNTFRGRTSIDSRDATDLALAYDSVSSEELLGAGGNYSTTDGRVQLTVLPDQVSPAVVRAVIEQAENYPTADVALVAPLEGPSAPSVYLNKVSAEEADAILSALSDPDLAAELVAPFTIPVVIRSDAGDTSGFVGGVDPASK